MVSDGTGIDIRLLFQLQRIQLVFQGIADFSHLPLGEDDIGTIHIVTLDRQHDHDVAVPARHEQITHAFLLDLTPFGVRFAVRMQGLGGAADKLYLSSQTSCRESLQGGSLARLSCTEFQGG
jgi:hypothetical protein